jgi:hypothetical protein
MNHDEPVLTLDWDQIDRLLQDLCEGHGRYMTELYRLDLPTGGWTWLCQSCYVTAWINAGRPPQRRLGATDPPSPVVGQP